MKKLFILGIFIFSLSSLLNAQIVTDRPDVTESSSVIPKNSFQIESGMVMQKSSPEQFSPVHIYAPSTLFRFGISKYFELRFFTQYQNDLSFGYFRFPYINSGFNDIEVGTKVQLFKKESSRTEIAFLTHLLIPAGADNYTNSEYISINKVAVSHAINDFLGIGYNAGYVYDFSGVSTIVYSVSVGYSINDKFGFYLEPYGSLTEFSEHEINFDGGLTYKIRENFQVDFSYGTGLNHYLHFYGIGFGWNIAREND